MTRFSGGCLCGALRYEGNAAPVFAGNCHCTECRRASGAGHMALFAVAAEAAEITGESKAYATKADSGADVAHHFCPNCGVRVFITNATMSAVKIFVASTLDDPAFYKPVVSVYASRALEWDPPNPSTRLFDEMPERDDGRS